MGENLFYGISIVLVMVLLSLGLTKVLKQPMMLGYILSGTLITIFFPDLIHNNHALESFSHIGISFLLFMVGMELHPTVIKQMGKDSLIAGVLQVMICSILGFGLSLLLGLDLITSMFMGLALAFSSTIVIMKLLSDNGKIESTFGRLSIGILIIQDLVVILSFVLISTISGLQGNSGSEIILLLLGKIIAATGLVRFSFKYLIPYITKKIADSIEFLFLFAVGRCFLLASLFEMMGFGMEIGALLAGFSLATSVFRFEILSKIKSLRDFFLVMFFVLLGSHVNIEPNIMFFVRIIALSLFVIAIKPLVIDVILGLLGHTRKNTFLTGTSLGQISGFSFLMIGMVVSMGYIKNEQILSDITFIGLITIAISSYYILYGEIIYLKIKKYLALLPGKRHRNYNIGDPMKSDIIIVGFGKFGSNLYNLLKKTHNDIMVIEEDPEIISKLKRRKIKCIYGDGGNIEFLRELHLTDTKMVISMIKSYEDNIVLLENVKDKNTNTIVVLLSYRSQEAIDFYEKGADYVILPNHIGASHASSMLEEYGFDINKFMENKKRQIHNLRNTNKDIIFKALQRF